MRVLVTHSNILENDPKQIQKMRPFPPIGTLYVVSELIEAGFDVTFFDPTFDTSFETGLGKIKEINPEILVICEDNFNFISKMCLTHMRDTAFRMIQEAISSGSVTIAAGPDVSDHFERYFENGLHYAITGEPDNTIRELCLAIQDKKDKTNIPGIIFQDKNKEIFRCESREVEPNPDRFEPPARDLVNMDRYRDAWLEKHGYFMLNMASSRGCSYRCKWCAKPIWGNQMAQRLPERTAEEMAKIKRQYHPDRIWFTDDIFGHDARWLETFLKRLKELDGILPFVIQTRPDLITRESVDLLQQSGCMEIWIGAESGSQRILNSMNKGLTVNKIEEAVALIQKAGIRACTFIQLGYIEETLDDIKATIKLIRKTKPDDIGISVTYPLPGTEFYQSVKTELGDKQNWDHSNDLAMMFQGRYQTVFYRLLHDVLHEEVLFRQSLKNTSDEVSISDHLDNLLDGWFELGKLEIQARIPVPGDCE